MFMLCCTDVAILPRIVETALLVRYSTKTFFYLLEFLSTSLTLSFRGQLCFVEVLLTPHIECLCLHPFQSKSSSRCYWFFDPYLFEHSYFCVCHCERLLLFVHDGWIQIQILCFLGALESRALSVTVWVLRGWTFWLKFDGAIHLKTNVLRSVHSWLNTQYQNLPNLTAFLVNCALQNLLRGAWKHLESP